MKKDHTHRDETRSAGPLFLPDRKTPRADWHQYTGALYFVTFCTHRRAHYFGEIRNGQMVLSAVGIQLTAEIEKVKDYYPYAEIPVYVIMPDHVHLIAAIHPRRDAIHRVRETNNRVREPTVSVHESDESVREPTVSVREPSRPPTGKGGITGNVNPMLNETLGTVIRGLKARVTQFARQKNIPFKWQSRYHDHIIRNENEMNRIAKYIEQNPAKWKSP